jgi:dipeptidyl aminopeptidase/acylaminoacyl peptidase
MTQARRPITAEDLVAMPHILEPRLNVDGTVAAFVVGEASREGPRPRGAIWLVQVQGDDEPRQLTSGLGHDLAPRWSPDGRLLAFLSDRDAPGVAQPYIIDTHGGEAERLPAIAGVVKELEWSPDGTMLALMVTPPADDAPDTEPGKPDDVRVFGADWRCDQLWMLRITDRSTFRLTPRDRHAVALSWSPDSTRLAVITRESSWADSVYSSARIDLYPACGGDRAEVAEVPGKAKNLSWSPDGATLVFRGPAGRLVTDDAIYLVSAGGGSSRLLTTGYVGAITYVGWCPTGNALLAAAVEYETSTLLKVFVDETKPVLRFPENLRRRGYFESDPSFNADASIVAFVRSAGNEPAELWAGPLSSPKRRTAINSAAEQWATGHVEQLRWEGADGMEISGLLVYPANHDPDRRYPLILQIHGGPTAYWTDRFQASWHDWAQYLASHGYAVLLPNPRGSSGRGSAFAEANWQDYGGKELEDSLRGVDKVITMGLADPERLGVGGWSHGGYMTARAITLSKRFKAAVMGAGMGNLVSDQGQNDIPRANDQYFSSRTYEDPDFFMRRSPINDVQQVTTPLLLVHGSADDRVSPLQSREFYIALRLLEKTAVLVTYPHEGHSFEERGHQADLLRRILAWYDRYLMDPAGA